MRKFFILGAAFFVSLAMLLSSCKKDEVNNNGNNNGNTETPGGYSGGGSGGGSEGGSEEGNYNNQEYPSTADVIRKAVTDVDGNIYDAVQIGNQVWMAENLRTTRFADGTTIPMGSTYSYAEPYRYAPGLNQSNEENMANVARYGYLYNWPALMHGASSSSANPSGVQGICPTGWHIPSDAEWTQLIAYVGSHSEYVCNGSGENIAKALASNNGWLLYDGDECAVGNNPYANNATGFSALPAGYYLGNYARFGANAFFWGATEGGEFDAYYRSLSYDNTDVGRSGNYKGSGFSVRCVRN